MDGKTDEMAFYIGHAAHQYRPDAGKPQVPAVYGLRIVDVPGDPVAGKVGQAIEEPPIQINSSIGIG